MNGLNRKKEKATRQMRPRASKKQFKNLGFMKLFKAFLVRMSDI